MRIIVCGSHKRGDVVLIFERLDYLAARWPIDLVAQGGAECVDKYARQWAEAHGVEQQEYPADWWKYGKAAGPIRNQAMFDAVKPDGVVAFPGDGGTANMVSIAERAGVPVWFPCGRESVRAKR